MGNYQKLIKISQFINLFLHQLHNLARLLLIFPTVILLLIVFISPALAETSELPKACRIGVYLGSLRNLDMANKSFTADFWTWSVCPSQEFKPLDNMVVVNSKDVKTGYDNVLEKKDLFGLFNYQEKVYWSQRKISANLYQDWNVSNYPFDRHVLEIGLEEAVYNKSVFVYTPDITNSTYKHDMKLDGWRITNFKVREEGVNYEGTFGDPELFDAKSTYSRLIISISIQRDKFLSFFKLTMVVYAAFAISLLSFFYDSNQTSLMSARTSLVVGSLFASVVNMRVVEGVLGRTEALTLVDKIHITTIAYIFIIALLGVRSRLVSEANQVKEAKYFDRRIAFTSIWISFLVVNIILILQAMKAG